MTTDSATTTATTDTTAGRRTRARLAVRAGVLLTMIVGLLLTVVQPASAATWGYGNYNPWSFRGCQIRAGAVYDPYTTASGAFDVYGGGQFAACSTRHNYEVYVQEQYSTDNQTFYNIGAMKDSGLFSNAYGMAANNIAVTGPACGSVYWRTAVDVWADGYWSGWVYSTARWASATRC